MEASWQSVAGERRRKYYRITNQGLDELAEQRRQWGTVVDTLKEIWLDFDLKRDFDLLRSLRTLEVINNAPVDDFWRGVGSK